MPLEKTSQPRRRNLLLMGTIAMLLAAGIAANGIIQRARSGQAVARWTDQQAIPTIALARLSPEQGQTVTLPGTIQAHYKASIYARVNGYLKSWQTDIGAHVTNGQVMATISTPDLDQQFQQALAALATATANFKLAAITAQRTNALLKSRWVSQQAADNNNSSAAAAKAAMDSAAANVKRLAAMESFKNIVAPFDGVVTARNTDIGALINAGNSGQELFEVSDLHQVRVYVQVPQSFSAEIHPGLRASFVLPQYPGQQFDATVVTASNSMNANSRSMLVELLADNSAGEFFAGAYAQVSFRLPPSAGAVRVPATALIAGDNGISVATLGTDDRVHLKHVQIGRDFGDAVEVVAGLSLSDRVIDNPPGTMQNGDVVRLAGEDSVSPQAARQAPLSNS